MKTDRRRPIGQTAHEGWAIGDSAYELGQSETALMKWGKRLRSLDEKLEGQLGKRHVYNTVYLHNASVILYLHNDIIINWPNNNKHYGS